MDNTTDSGRPPPLARPVTDLAGVGPERAIQLARLGITTIEDLLLHRPRRYEDRRHFLPIDQLQLGAPAMTRGTVVALGVKWFRRHTKSIFELVLQDASTRLHCRWWNLPFMEKYFAVGDEIIVSGKLRQLKPRTMDHPETEVVEPGEENLIHLNRITPVYPLTEGLAQRWLRSLVWRTLSQFESSVREPWPQFTVPGGGGTGHLLSRAAAIRRLHFPEEMADIESARRRLALDEFIELQIQMRRRRLHLETKAQALPCGGDNRLMKPFLARLGFKLTRSQTEVLREMRKDLSGPHPMRRLLQGDVGSGKTVVAACCGLMALESGYSVALMAPTELLAEQHFLNFKRWFGPLGIDIELQTGANKIAAAHSRDADGPHQRQGQAPPQPVFTLGTHALLTAGFELPNLGLVIIDEQHRFGVSQREQLVRKGRYPHLLVMTATPIPRTLGLTLYGDLDVSTIDELPPGRGQIHTLVRAPEKLSKVWDFLRGKLSQGRQAYIVYPRIDDTTQNLKAVTTAFGSLQTALAPFRLGLVHGRLGAKETAAVMAGFRANQLQVLVATSLVEVGLDVPNATIMVIEEADQFGLAQLHQLRGRIGRGAEESYCVLVAGNRSSEACQRLKVLEETSDGFRIAEADMRLRGPGELLGLEQSGKPSFKFGDLDTDIGLITQARQLAAQWLPCLDSGLPG